MATVTAKKEQNLYSNKQFSLQLCSVFPTPSGEAASPEISERLCKETLGFLPQEPKI